MAASMLGNIYGGAMAQQMSSGLPNPTGGGNPTTSSSVAFGDYPNSTPRIVFLIVFNSLWLFLQNDLFFVYL